MFASYGCPLSPLLCSYILVAEVLGCNPVRASSFIEDFRVLRRLILKLTQYPDDTTRFVHDIFSLQKLLALTDAYACGTGARLNVTKTVAMWLGAYANRTEKPLRLRWLVNMKVLGMFFGANSASFNCYKRATSFKNLLDWWIQRNLSVKGRVTGANTLGLSRFYYIAKIFIPQILL